MKKLKIRNLVDFLKENNIDFELVLNGIDIDDDFSFASVKNIVTKGVFYLENIESLSKFEISNSVVVSNKKTKTNNCLIVVSNPQLVHYKLSSLAIKPIIFEIAKTTKINPKAKLSKNISIGENCVIGECVIEEGVVIKHNVVIEDNVTIKKNSFIDSNSVIGAGGLAWIWDECGNRVIQPQLGGVIIEENCSLATDVTVVKGSLTENTLIGKGTIIAHGTKIGHGAQIMSEVHMANNVSIAGNAVVGNRCFLGSACVISSSVKIADYTIVGAGAVVNKNIEEEFCTLAGVPAKVIKKNNFDSKPNGAPKPFKNK
jgi:UDP-3-O-[3-hydroxymyristoyl] glucosamine N-acyltransferase